MITLRQLRLIAAGVALALAGAITADLLPHKAKGQAITSVQLPVATVGSITGTASTLIATNPGRRTYTICNASGGGTLFVLPGTAVTVTTSNGVLIAAGTCLSPPANLLQSGTAGGGGNSWQAISGSTTTATFLEW